MLKVAGIAGVFIVAACAEGYAFPTNLDHDQPVEGLAPPSQADLVWQALAEQWDPATLLHVMNHWIIALIALPTTLERRLDVCAESTALSMPARTAMMTIARTTATAPCSTNRVSVGVNRVTRTPSRLARGGSGFGANAAQPPRIVTSVAATITAATDRDSVHIRLRPRVPASRPGATYEGAGRRQARYFGPGPVRG